MADLYGNGYGTGTSSTLPWQTMMQLPWQQPSYQGVSAPQAQTPNNSQSGNGNILSSLLQAIPAIQAGFKGNNIAPQQQSTAQLQQISDALMNPDNPLYQKLYGQNKQLLQQNEGNALSQAEGQNRMLSAMGRTPLFSPERNGEVAFRTMIQNQGQAGLQAQNQTENQLGNAGLTLSRLMPAQNNVTQLQQGNTNQKLGSFANIATALKLFGL